MKLLVQNGLSYCVKEKKPCISWVDVYFKDCLCDVRDELSFGFGLEHGTDSVYGQWLGWMMAAIYMGGRLPQIWLNIKRGSVEGLNPLMFIFALLANATYVASILVRSTAWSKISANMPWLLDAAGCVGLDLFYVYYKNFRKKDSTVREEDYVEDNNK